MGSAREEEFRKKLIAAFHEEAAERMESLSASLMGLEDAWRVSGGGDLPLSALGGEAAELLESVYREVHSLKGASRTVEFFPVEQLCQAAESVLWNIKHDRLYLTARRIDTLHLAVDLVHGMLRQASESGEVTPPGSFDAVMDRLAGAASETGASDVDSVPKARANGSAESSRDRGHSDQSGRQVAASDEGAAADSLGFSAPAAVVEAPVRVSDYLIKTEDSPDPAQEPSDRMGAPGARSASPFETVRIPARRLDSLLLRSEELLSVRQGARLHAQEVRHVVARLEAMRREWDENASPDAEVMRRRGDSLFRALEEEAKPLLSEIERLQRELGKTVDELLTGMKLAVMMPFHSLFEGFAKVVRDLSRDQGKKVVFEVDGDEIEIDRRILEQLRDPFIHLLRNAVDHGVESPSVRAEAGKPEAGTIRLSVSRLDGAKVEVVFEDDGGGIALDRVKAGAVKMGLVRPENLGELSDADAVRLIFASELSTSPMVTDISGRGLGMSIVREKVEKAGGSVEVQSEPGQGTRFSIKLPVAMTSFPGFVVMAGGGAFVIPKSGVERVYGVRRAEFVHAAGRECVRVGGELTDVVSLGSIFGLPEHPDMEREGALPALMLVSGERRQLLLVDEITAEHDVMLKGLGSQLQRVRNVAGVTRLGTGRLVPVLNVSDLISSAKLPRRAAPAVQMERGPASILVVEDSITSRMLIKNILEASGFRVTTAVDGRDALTVLGTEHFDVVVTDVEMPRLDGFELTEAIRGDDSLADLPVILVTSLSKQEHRERGVTAGANAYIVKSGFDQGSLLHTVRSFLP